ncbi:MAG: hypothetical protein GY805_31365, partial [Chloroflexi bacterium]|nr:hypothetical protein [Chloroflexota bacterium]
MIRAFIEAEFFKLRHLRITKITILAMLLTPIVTIGILWRLETAYTVFPGAMELFGDSLLMVGLISLLLLAAAVGNEYEQGTVRMIISRGTPRWLFVA